MKRLAPLSFMVMATACAWGSMIDDIKETIDNLDTGQCIRECNDGHDHITGAKGCLDVCDIEADGCDLAYETSVDAAKLVCDENPDEYDACVEEAEDKYEAKFFCSDKEETCEEDCKDVGAECVAVCVEELEADLKNIDL